MASRAWLVRAGLLVAGLLVACGGEDAPRGGAAPGGDLPITPIGPGAPRCTAEGCACEAPGTTTTCKIDRVGEGGYVWCTEGLRTCGDDRKWGRCVGDEYLVDAGADGTLARDAEGDAVDPRTLLNDAGYVDVPFP